MTENEWLTCTDPTPMLEYLRGKASDRKLRLFVCACCRFVFSEFTHFDGGIEEAIESSEWYADGLVGEDVRRAAELVAQNVEFGTSYDWLVNQALMATVFETLSVADVWLSLLRYSQQYAVEDCRIPRPDQMASHACRVLRDVFGPLPFRPVIVEVSWLAWGDGTVPKLAQAVHDDRAFDRLPVLADALEEAGCDNTDILGHLRSPGPHVRGCWAVDLLLGKE